MPDISVMREKVFAAAAELSREGKRVSNRTVRERLGSGSPNEICPHVKKWHVTFGPVTNVTPPNTPLPDRVTQAFAQGLDLMRLAIVQEVKAGFEVQSADMANQLAKASAEVDSAVQDYIETDSELQSARADIEALQARFSASVASVDSLQQEVAQRAADEGAAIACAEELRLRVTDLRSELDTAHRLQQHERDQSEGLRRELTRTISELETTRLAMANANAEIVATRAALADCREQSAIALAEVTAKACAAALECEAARLDARQQAELAAHLRGELDGARRQAEEFMAMIKDNAKLVAAKSTTKAVADAKHS